MTLGNLARVLGVCAACFAAAASATSNQQAGQAGPPQYSGTSAPSPQQMDPARALGTWESTFGGVKIEGDNSKGGLQVGALQGVWMYQRQGQEVIGYFAGQLQGNVLKFHWQEPDNPPLTGEGYLVFDQTGRQYTGRWWSDRHDRTGDWNGWRKGGGAAEPGAYGAGGQGYGGYPQQPQGGYGAQPQPQPYAPQGGYYPPRQPQPPQGGYYPQPQPYPAPQGGQPAQPQPQPYPAPQGGQPQQPPQGGYYPQPYPPQGGQPAQPQPQPQPQPAQQPYY